MTKSAAIGVTAVERLVDILSLAALGMVVSFFLPTQRWAGYAAPIVLAGGAVLLVALWLTAGQRVHIGRAELGSPQRGGGLASRLCALGERFAPGVKVLRERGVLARVLALSLLDWGCEVIMVVLCAHSLGVPIGLALAPVILLGINLAIALPAAPASTGPFEGAMVVVLTLAGVARGPSNERSGRGMGEEKGAQRAETIVRRGALFDRSADLHCVVSFSQRADLGGTTPFLTS